MLHRDLWDERMFERIYLWVTNVMCLHRVSCSFLVKATGGLNRNGLLTSFTPKDTSAGTLYLVNRLGVVSEAMGVALH